MSAKTAAQTIKKIKNKNKKVINEWLFMSSSIVETCLLTLLKSLWTFVREKRIRDKTATLEKYKILLELW